MQSNSISIQSKSGGDKITKKSQAKGERLLRNRINGKDRNGENAAKLTDDFLGKRTFHSFLTCHSTTYTSTLINCKLLLIV